LWKFRKKAEQNHHQIIVAGVMVAAATATDVTAAGLRKPISPFCSHPTKHPS
jgi:hypothetical protein